MFDFVQSFLLFRRRAIFMFSVRSCPLRIFCLENKIRGVHVKFYWNIFKKMHCLQTRSSYFLPFADMLILYIFFIKVDVKVLLIVTVKKAM